MRLSAAILREAGPRWSHPHHTTSVVTARRYIFLRSAARWAFEQLPDSPFYGETEVVYPGAGATWRRGIRVAYPQSPIRGPVGAARISGRPVDETAGWISPI